MDWDKERKMIQKLIKLKRQKLSMENEIKDIEKKLGWVN